MQFLINHFYLFFAISLGIFSQLIIKWKMSSFSFSDYPTMYDKYYLVISLLINPWIMLCLGLNLASGLTWMIAMTKFELSYAYPFTIIPFVLIYIFSVLIFGETITWQKTVGIFFIAIGVIIVSKV